MSTTVKCDKCGNVLKEQERFSLKIERNAWSGIHMFTADLCIPCIKELQTFIPGMVDTKEAF